MEGLIGLAIIGIALLVAVGIVFRGSRSRAGESAAERHRRQHELIRMEHHRANDGSRGFGGITGGDGGAH